MLNVRSYTEDDSKEMTNICDLEIKPYTSNNDYYFRGFNFFWKKHLHNEFYTRTMQRFNHVLKLFYRIL